MLSTNLIILVELLGLLFNKYFVLELSLHDLILTFKLLTLQNLRIATLVDVLSLTDLVLVFSLLFDIVEEAPPGSITISFVIQFALLAYSLLFIDGLFGLQTDRVADLNALLLVCQETLLLLLGLNT